MARTRAQTKRPTAQTGALPLYKQITGDIERRIARGEWADGAPLPSENELVRRLGVSRMTVHRALRELSERGVLSRIKGVGTFVATAPPARSELIAIRDIAEDIARRGHKHASKVIALGEVRADIDLATAFETKVGAKLFRSLIVHYEDDAPIQIEERFVNPKFAPDYLKQNFSKTTPTAYLQRVGSATEVEQIIYAAAAGAQEQRLLKMTANAPCLLLARRTWRDGAPATKSLFTFPGDRYSLGSRYAESDFKRLPART